MSDTSKTTVGGVEFDDLLRGSRNYACHLANLASETEVKGIKKKLIEHLKQTVRELELQSDRTIAKIYIGKSYVQQRQKRGGGKGYQKFDPQKHDTWRKNGISSRWGEHKKKDYGRDGLVVLGVFTKETVHKICRGRVHQEDFALAMEQMLLHHYLLSHHPDPRVVNESFATGKTTQKNCVAYVVYMAFSYKERSQPSTMCQYSEPGPSNTPPPPSPTNSPPAASLMETQPILNWLTQQAISTTACSNEQQTAETEEDIQETSPMMNQDTESGTPTRPTTSSPATRLYQPPQTSETTNPSPSNTQPEETQQSIYRKRHRETESLQMSEAGPSHMQSRTPSRTRSSRRRVRFKQDSQSSLMLQRFRFTD